MIRQLNWLVCLGLLVSLGAATEIAAAKGADIPVIFDADIDSDVDDVGCLAVLHALANRGEATILGVIATTEDIDGPACAAAINTYYHRPGIPIGVNKEARPDPNLPNYLHLRTISKYAKPVAQEFPHSFESYDHAECAVSLYRRLLAAADDNSVVIVTVGHLTNLKNLLLSEPCEHSELYGFGLIQRKVKLWVCVGGRYPGGKEPNFYRPDPESTGVCVNNWPSKVVFSGWELGNGITTGDAWFKQNVPQDGPIYRAYELYNNFAGRPSWDQTAVLYAVRGTMNDTLWTVHWEGSNYVYPDGANEWRSSPDLKNQGYLIAKMPKEDIARLLNELMIEKPLTHDRTKTGNIISGEYK